MNVCLEMEKSPFLLSDGAGNVRGEILRAGNWRKFILFTGGKCKGVCMAEKFGAAERFGRLGYRFYPAGTWETGEPVAAGLIPKIRPEVENVIRGTAQAEFDDSGVSSLPCQ